MPLYLVTREFPNGPTTIAAPVITQDIELEAADLLEAAVRVMDLPKNGRLPEGMTRRQTYGAYDDIPIKADPDRYDGVACIVVGSPESLPRAVSIRAAEAAIGACCAVAQIDDEGDPVIGTHHLVHALADHLTSLGEDFDVLLREAVSSRNSGFPKHAGTIPDLVKPGDACWEYSSAAGKAAVERYAEVTGRTGRGTVETTKDIVVSLIALARKRGFDLLESLNAVAEDRELDRRSGSTVETGTNYSFPTTYSEALEIVLRLVRADAPDDVDIKFGRGEMNVEASRRRHAVRILTDLVADDERLDDLFQPPDVFTTLENHGETDEDRFSGAIAFCLQSARHVQPQDDAGRSAVERALAMTEDFLARHAEAVDATGQSSPRP